ncbi:FGGY family carbohydrate kinase [Nitrosomonas aestuarii]|nr:FGGY family carbohydrate kinase [Nitrosomonas aestuarii]
MAAFMIAVGLDLGTTSIKAALMDRQGALCFIINQPAPVIRQTDGQYESDALRYAETAEAVLTACLACTDHKPPLGLCSQRSSFLIWDKQSGNPITPLISWQDNRGQRYHDQTGNAKTLIPSLTGLRLASYYYAPKLSVLLHDNPQWREKLTQGVWLTGTLDAFLIWRWTQGQHFCTDASMAARTLLMNIHQQQWSSVLCDLFNIPAAILPQIKSTTGFNLPLSNGVVLRASAGDQSAAFYASVMNDPSKALVNLGTGGFVIRYLDGKTKPLDGFLQTLVYQDQNYTAYMASEGTLNSISSALAPYPSWECNIDDFATSNILCLAEPSGLGAPYFCGDIGLRFSESTEHLMPKQIATLLLEAIVFRVVRILEAYHQQSPLSQVYLSGGLSELTCLQQGIAQCVSFPILHLQQKEASLLGAAMLAAGNNSHIFPLMHPIEIKIDRKNTVLKEKYRQWQVWLDGLLSQQMRN